MLLRAWEVATSLKLILEDSSNYFCKKFHSVFRHRSNSSAPDYLSLQCFPVAKIPKAQWERDKNMNTNMEISVAHGQTASPLPVRISTNQRNSILVHFVDWLFHALQTLANEWLSNYNISIISSNVLSLGSFFSQHRTFDTLWFQLHYNLTP